MLTVGEYCRIRCAFRDVMGIREISRKFGHSRNKVREILRGDGEPRRYDRRQRQSAPKIGPVKEHDPTTDVPCVAFQLGSQLSSRVAGVDEEQVARLDVDRQRVPLNKRKHR